MRFTEAWAEQLLQDAWFQSRTPRSREYRAGMVAGTRAEMGLGESRCPYLVGTARADAWWAGLVEGRALVAVWESTRGEAVS